LAKPKVSLHGYCRPGRQQQCFGRQWCPHRPKPDRGRHAVPLHGQGGRHGRTPKNLGEHKELRPCPPFL